jgi:hypothetical protein
MTPKIWGPPVWIFLHTFSVNISEYGYSQIGLQFYSYVTRICRQLPCPECSEHATKFISKVNPGILKTKYDMANMLCNFHNVVNSRKKLPIFNNSYLSMYEKISIISAFNNFVQAFTIPSQRLMNDTLHRKMLVTQIQKFLQTNLVYFVKQTPKISISPPEPEPPRPTPTPRPTTPPLVDNITYEVSYNSEEKEEEEEEEEILSIEYSSTTNEQILSLSY